MFAWIASFAVTKLGNAGGKLLEFIVAMGLLLVLVGGPYWLGLRHQTAVDQIAQQQAQIVSQQKLAKAQAVGQQIATQLAVNRVKTQIVYQTITKEVPHVIVKYRTAPGAPLQLLPRFVFTVGAVGLWNCALDPSLSATACESPDAASGTDPALDAGISEQQLLSNHIDNAERCDDIRQQLQALIDWHHQTAGVH